MRTLSLKRPYMRGADVKRVQRIVGATQDSTYGPKTVVKVREYQRREGIKPISGVTGSITWRHIVEDEKKIPPTPARRSAINAVFADLSGWNEGVNLRDYRDSGHRIIVLKATQGTDFTSDAFVERWKKARELGLKRVAYHWAEPHQSTPEAEARVFAAFVKRHGLYAADVLALDWEEPKWTRKGDVWVARFVTASPPQLDFLYSYGPYAARTLTRMPRGLRYWHAAYIRNPTSTVPAWARPYLSAVQHTDGINGNPPHYAPGCGTLGGKRRCDMNRLLVPWLSWR